MFNGKIDYKWWFFHSYVSHYQRVDKCTSSHGWYHRCWLCWPIPTKWPCRHCASSRASHNSYAPSRNPLPHGFLTRRMGWKTAPNIGWLVVSTPLKNISQLGWLVPIYGKMKNVPNHQPDRGFTCFFAKQCLLDFDETPILTWSVVCAFRRCPW